MAQRDGGGGLAASPLALTPARRQAHSPSGGSSALALAVHELNRSQRELALAGGRASAVALMMSLAGRADRARLERQQRALAVRLSLGERALGELRDQVDDQGDALQVVSGQVEEQSGSIRDLERRVQEQRESVARMAQAYQRELEDQRRMLESHKSEFGQLILSKLKQDATLDAVIVLLSWVLAQTPVVSWPVLVLSNVGGALPIIPLRRQRARSAAVAQAARMAVILFCARSLRVVAARHGLHNSVGTPSIYASRLLGAMGERLALFRAMVGAQHKHRSGSDARPPADAGEAVTLAPSAAQATSEACGESPLAKRRDVGAKSAGGPPLNGG